MTNNNYYIVYKKPQTEKYTLTKKALIRGKKTTTTKR